MRSLIWGLLMNVGSVAFCIAGIIEVERGNDIVGALWIICALLASIRATMEERP